MAPRRPPLPHFDLQALVQAQAVALAAAQDFGVSVKQMRVEAYHCARSA